MLHLFFHQRGAIQTISLRSGIKYWTTKRDGEGEGQSGSRSSVWALSGWLKQASQNSTQSAGYVHAFGLSTSVRFVTPRSAVTLIICIWTLNIIKGKLMILNAKYGSCYSFQTLTLSSCYITCVCDDVERHYKYGADQRSHQMLSCRSLSHSDILERSLTVPNIFVDIRPFLLSKRCTQVLHAASWAEGEDKVICSKPWYTHVGRCNTYWVNWWGNRGRGPRFHWKLLMQTRKEIP